MYHVRQPELCRLCFRFAANLGLFYAVVAMHGFKSLHTKYNHDFCSHLPYRVNNTT